MRFEMIVKVVWIVNGKNLEIGNSSRQRRLLNIIKSGSNHTIGQISCDINNFAALISTAMSSKFFVYPSLKWIFFCVHLPDCFRSHVYRRPN